MTQPELEALCSEWQHALRLRDWDLKVRFARQFEIEGADGLTKHQVNWKTASIKVLDRSDHEPERAHQPDTEQILVHELVHLHFAGCEPEAARITAFEQGIDLIAWALVKLKRLADNASRVQE